MAGNWRRDYAKVHRATYSAQVLEAFTVGIIYVLFDKGCLAMRISSGYAPYDRPHAPAALLQFCGEPSPGCDTVYPENNDEAHDNEAPREPKAQSRMRQAYRWNPVTVVAGPKLPRRSHRRALPKCEGYSRS